MTIDHAAPPATGRDVPLHIDAATFRELGHALVDRIAEHFETLRDRPVGADDSPTEIQRMLDADAPLPEEGEAPGEVLRSASDVLFGHSRFNAHPRFFGYITASPAPIGILGDLLASAINPNVGAWILSPVATEIERQTVRWMAQLIGFPDTCGGLLVSGGNMANFVCFLAARAAAAEWAVREGGMRAPDARTLRVYGSAETHTWIQKAADLAGLGTESIRWIPVDGQQRMDVAALRRTIAEDRAAGDVPMCVIATAGSVSTGAVDPIDELADVCEAEDIWLHIDGAYGGFAAAVPSQAARFRGLERADSIAVDPHKWLYAPLEAGCAMVRDPDALRRAFAYHPPYYHFGVEATNLVDFGPQNSRGFRALKVWLGLRQAGRSGAVRMIADDIRLSERMFAAADAHPDLEALTQDLSIATFRFVPAEWRDRRSDADVAERLDTLNRELLARLERSGEVFVSNAIVNGRFALRACIVNFNTTDADVDAIPAIVARHGRVLLEETP